MQIPESINRLVTELQKLPGIGRKGAERIAYYMLKNRETAISIADAVVKMEESVRFCSVCGAFTETDPCGICSSANRKHESICVVENPKDILSIEKTGYKGLYHVLMGSLNPLAGIGPDELRIAELVDRVKTGTVREIIVATNPTTDGESTGMYISRVIKETCRAGGLEPARVTRIARGLPVGGDIEFADEVTLLRSMEGRQDL